ncbi:hypothetical protein AABM38_21745 [Heyndrickxia sp. MSNUG]|uniref:hypothetical protein n=1 Tax=Heyndrickxia sp. MSNUG TaxID=3136677 RepID=UPI003C2C5CF8
MNGINYGKYSVSEDLQQLFDLQADLAKKDLLPYGDLLGYYFSLDDIRYLNTPLDLLSFARPGGDGIHYGFLTDFGLVKALEEAYIVRVSPMDIDDSVNSRSQPEEFFKDDVLRASLLGFAGHKLN